MGAAGFLALSQASNVSRARIPSAASKQTRACRELTFTALKLAGALSTIEITDHPSEMRQPFVRSHGPDLYYGLMMAFIRPVSDSVAELPCRLQLGSFVDFVCSALDLETACSSVRDSAWSFRPRAAEVKKTAISKTRMFSWFIRL